MREDVVVWMNVTQCQAGSNIDICNSTLFKRYGILIIMAGIRPVHNDCSHTVMAGQ